MGDLNFKEGVTVINDPEEMIAKIVQTSAARAELLEGEEGEGEEGEEEIEEGAEPEVISKGKDDEDKE